MIIIGPAVPLSTSFKMESDPVNFPYEQVVKGKWPGCRKLNFTGGGGLSALSQISEMSRSFPDIFDIQNMDDGLYVAMVIRDHLFRLSTSELYS